LLIIVTFEQDILCDNSLIVIPQRLSGTPPAGSNCTWHQIPCHTRNSLPRQKEHVKHHN